MPTSDSAFVPRIQRALVRNQWTLDSLAARMRFESQDVVGFGSTVR